MRILIINPEFYPVGGGAGKACYYFVKELRNRGIDVHVITTKVKKITNYPTDTDLNILRVFSFQKEQYHSSKIHQAVFSVIGLAGLFINTWKWEPDVIIAFFGVPSGLMAMIYKLIRSDKKLPLIVSLRGSDVPGFREYDHGMAQPLLRFLVRWVWDNADTVVANSNGLKKLAQVTSQRINFHVVPNGVDTDVYQPNNRDWSGARIISVGRITHQKGFDLLLTALARLKDLEWDLSIIGSGPESKAIIEQSIQLGIDQKLRISGWLNEEELVKEYQAATIFALPSRDEGMSNALLEALSSGLPVVMSAVSGAPELIKDGKNGFLIDKEDVDELAYSLKLLITDKSLRIKMGGVARKNVKAFSWSTTVEKYLGFIGDKIE